MVQVALLTLVVAPLLARSIASQIPLTSKQPWKDSRNPAIASISGDDDTTEWRLDETPDPDATDHLVFETAQSLLQHWPNTRMRNGHNIVPGIIPSGTLLYHGRSDKKIPKGPEWIATDPEHSHLFCYNFANRSAGGWHLTMMVTRPLKMLYFDGNSAAKFPLGSMDTQDLLAWGKQGTDKDMIVEEAKRAQDLCEWGKNFGVDGFVRMEMDFEGILCDFTSGITVVSFDNLPYDQWGDPSGTYQWFEIIHAGTWHNHFPGETRVRLDLSRLVSFYDTQLAPSLVPIRAGQERWDHRIINVSTEDLAAVKSRLEVNLLKPDGSSSGIDWKTLIQVIVDRYAQRLELTRYLLNSSTTNPDEVLDLARKAQTQLRIMLTPYLLLSAVPDGSSNDERLDWVIPIYKLCSTTHTRSMESQFGPLTGTEELLLQAVRGTSREICRVLTKMWAAGVYAGIDPSLNTKESPDVTRVARLRTIWKEELNSLMSWLDWIVWVKCDPGCGAEEMCYLPTWPVGFPWFSTNPPPPSLPIDNEEDFVSHQGMGSLALRTMITSRLTDELRNTIKPGPDEWKRPQPKCIRRIRPYTY